MNVASSGTQSATVGVVIDADRMAAWLTIPAACPRSMLTEAYCTEVLRSQNVEVNPAVLAAIKKAIAEDPNDGQTYKPLVARGQPPRHGADGRIEWDVGGEASDDQASFSHYERCAFVMVTPGQVVGAVRPATLGEDGRDVMGATIAARDGRTVELGCDETILVDANGRVIAQAEGVLIRKDGRVCVRKVIEIQEAVDFSTGNIEFSGDVIVHGGVKDRFQIRAGGGVEVHGLIEAAQIHCDGDLVARGGFAGRERGWAHVGGDLVGRYLDNVEAEVKGDLAVEREAINCDMLVHGAVHMPNGAIIGGRVIVTHEVEVGMLGSGAGVATEVHLGSVPRLEPLAHELDGLLEQLVARRDDLLAEQTRLEKLAKIGRLTSVDKELQTEIMWMLTPLSQKVVRGQLTQDALGQRINEERTIELTVHRRLNGGVRIIVNQTAFRVLDQQRGPLRIFQKGKEMLYQKGESKPQPLAQIADVSFAGTAAA